MRDPRHYLEEIRTNMQKMQAQQQVRPTDNALFGMVDGLAGLMLVTLERVTDLERRVQALDGGPGPAQRIKPAEPVEQPEQPPPMA